MVAARRTKGRPTMDMEVVVTAGFSRAVAAMTMATE